MASRITALRHYLPQIEYGETAQWQEVAELLAARSTLNAVDVIGVLTGLNEAMIHFLSRGRGLKLEGIGTYLPNINYSGEFDVAHRLDRRLKRSLNSGSFDGKILNRKHIGKSAAEVIALWNSEHPDDPVIN